MLPPCYHGRQDLSPVADTLKLALVSRTGRHAHTDAGNRDVLIYCQARAIGHRHCRNSAATTL